MVDCGTPQQRAARPVTVAEMRELRRRRPVRQRARWARRSRRSAGSSSSAGHPASSPASPTSCAVEGSRHDRRAPTERQSPQTVRPPSDDVTDQRGTHRCRSHRGPQGSDQARVRRQRAGRAHRRRRAWRPTASSPSSARPRATAGSTTTPASSPTARSARCSSTKGSRTAEQVKEVPIVWSGGTDGVISPHATIFATVPADAGRADRRAAAHRRLRDERAAAARGHRPGRRWSTKVADAVKVAMERAGITDPADVHYVQTKTPLLTIHTIRDAKSRGKTVWTEETHESMDLSNGCTALGVAVGARRDRHADRRRRHAQPRRCTRRSPRAPRASSSTRPRSSSSATPAASAAATGSATR